MRSAVLLFCIFLGCIAISFFKNGLQSDAREVALLVLSLAAYPAARLVAGKSNPSTFIATTGAIVVVGSVVTIIALIGQWSEPHGKPLVFGYDIAPAAFTISLTFMLIALSCTDLNWKGTVAICCFIVIPIAVFSASVVRFPLVAMIAALMATALMSNPSTYLKACLLLHHA